MSFPDPTQTAILDHFELAARERILQHKDFEKIQQSIDELIAEYEANDFLIPAYEIGPVTQTDDGRMCLEIRLLGWPDIKPALDTSIALVA